MRQLKAWYQECAFLHVAGKTSAEIAETVGKSPRSVERALARDDVKALVDDILSENAAKLSDNAAKLSEARQRIIEMSYEQMEHMIQSPKTPPSVKAKLIADALKGFGEFVDRKELDIEGEMNNHFEIEFVEGEDDIDSSEAD